MQVRTERERKRSEREKKGEGERKSVLMKVNVLLHQQFGYVQQVIFICLLSIDFHINIPKEEVERREEAFL